MGAGHFHLTGLERAPRASDRTSILLASIVGVVVFFTLIGVAMTWPDNQDFRGVYPSVSEGGRWVEADVVALNDDGSTDILIRGEESDGVHVMTAIRDPMVELEVGDRVRAMELADGQILFGDFARSVPLMALFIVYVLVVIAVAWWRGFGALVGLFSAFGIVIFYTVPALFGGGNPLVVALVTGSGALFVLLYVAHGPNARTTTAYLGTLAGLLITTVIAWWAVENSRLVGIWGTEGAQYELWLRGVSLQGVVLCGIILAGMGVLNDVTVAQSSAVWELRAARPDMNRWELFARGMRIGRDHIASTVYTIAFAYVGAALPMIMLLSLYDVSLGTTLTTSEIAEEVVRTLVGSIGLVLAVPLTTAIGAMVVGENAVKDVDIAEEPQPQGQ